MKLYQNPASPPCRRVLATVYHLNSPVEMMHVEFGSGEIKKEAFLKMNPNGAVPTLDDNGFHLWESKAIMQYLAELKGDQDCWPKDLKKRADINRWMSWQDCHLGQACGNLVWENFVKNMVGMGGPEERAVADATEDFHQYAAVLDKHLEGKKFVCGDKVTLADFSLGASFMYAVPGKLPMDKYKNIQAWYQRLEGVDAWKKSTPKF